MPKKIAKPKVVHSLVSDTDGDTDNGSDNESAVWMSELRFLSGRVEASV